MKKRLFILIITVLIFSTAGIIAVQAAESGSCGENVTWTLDDSGTLTISGTGEIQGFSCPNYVFFKSVIIESGVTGIDSYAFFGCHGLTSVTLPDSMTTIGYYAFANCFALTNITIPGSVTEIGNYVFFGCNNLTSITVAEDNPNYITENNVLFNKEKTTLILAAAKGISGAYTIPDSVTTIVDSAFKDCKSLTNITIPDSVIEIGGTAFNECSSLTSISIPDNVPQIGNYTFSGCSALTEVSIGNGVERIGDFAFSHCSSLTRVTLPGSVAGMGRDIFYNCPCLAELTIAEDNPKYTAENNILFNKEKTTLFLTAANGAIGTYTIPASVTTIGNYAFTGCSSLTSITIPGSVRSIGEWAFSDCNNLTGVTVAEDNPNYITENNVLFNKEKTTLILAAAKGISGAYTIPDSVTTIDKYAFNGCTNITSVTIPNSVTKIIVIAFDGCNSLTSITVAEDNPKYTAENNIIFNKEKTTLILAAKGISGAYTIPDSVTTIGSYAFDGCTGLTDVYYSGSKKQWKQIDIKIGNDALHNANIHCSDGTIAPALNLPPVSTEEMIKTDTEAGTEYEPAAASDGVPDEA